MKSGLIYCQLNLCPVLLEGKLCELWIWSISKIILYFNIFACGCRYWKQHVGTTVRKMHSRMSEVASPSPPIPIRNSYTDHHTSPIPGVLQSHPVCVIYIHSLLSSSAVMISSINYMQCNFIANDLENCEYYSLYMKSVQRLSLYAHVKS